MPTALNETKLVRLQFEVTKEKHDELKRACEATNIKTNRELVDNALALFFWAVKEVQRGRVIVSLDEVSGKYKEVTMPAFQQATNRAAEAKPELLSEYVAR